MRSNPKFPLKAGKWGLKDAKNQHSRGGKKIFKFFGVTGLPFLVPGINP